MTPREMRVVNHEMIYPQVDWTQVNQRFLSNLPKPEQMPMQGCFPEAEKHLYDPNPKNSLGKSYFAIKSHPFGYGYGFRTDQGVIKRGASGEIVHGYVWSDTEWNWVLHTKKDNNQKVPKIDWASREGAVHGYIWSGYDWVLHAQRPQDREKLRQKHEGDFNLKKKFKRRKESR